MVRREFRNSYRISKHYAVYGGLRTGLPRAPAGRPCAPWPGFSVFSLDYRLEGSIARFRNQRHEVRSSWSQCQNDSMGKVLASWFLGAMTTIGGVYALYDMRPKIEIVIGDSLDPTDPLATQFVISNKSVFTLANFDPFCAAVLKFDKWPTASGVEFYQDFNGRQRPLPGGRIDVVAVRHDSRHSRYGRSSAGQVDGRRHRSRGALRVSHVVRQIGNAGEVVTQASNDGGLKWLPAPRLRPRQKNKVGLSESSQPRPTASRDLRALQQRNRRPFYQWSLGRAALRRAHRFAAGTTLQRWFGVGA